MLLPRVLVAAAVAKITFARQCNSVSQPHRASMMKSHSTALSVLYEAALPSPVPQFGAAPLIFDHVGKAGGGTVGAALHSAMLRLDPNVSARVESAWGGKSTSSAPIPKAFSLYALVHTCHPHPCSPSTYRLAHRSIIPVRDPVDRYISAFDWRRMRCAGAGLDGVLPARVRLRLKTGAAPWPPEKEFAPKKGQRAVCDAIFERWGENANTVAEALCGRGHNARGAAASFIKQLPHVTGTLSARLQVARRINPGLYYYVVPMYRDNAGLPEFSTLAESAVRQLAIDEGVDLLDQLTPPVCAGRHTAVLGANSSREEKKLAQKSTLSAQGRACLQNYPHFAGDYDAIKLLLKHGGCRGALAEECKLALSLIIGKK
jgi:hypothetical protein